MKVIQKEQLKSNLKGAITAAIITVFFMYFVYYQGTRSIWAGMFIGFSIYMAIALYTEKIDRRYLRKLNLALVLVINTIMNLLIMLIIAWIGVGLFYMDGNFSKMFGNFRNLIGYYYQIGMLFGLGLSIFFNFFTIINTLIGKKVLGRLFIGKYRNPFEEQRVFMFIDLKSSTHIAERIGHVKFLSFVNDFLYDIVSPITITKGEIYKYVGDEAIITWTMKNGIKDANCIQCFFLIKNMINSRSKYYMDKYGTIPEFKAGVHGGTAITGELGYTKREIAFMGDVMNTTARIEEACKTYNSDLLISEELLNKITLPETLSTNKVGNVKFRGKENELGLIEIKN